MRRFPVHRKEIMMNLQLQLSDISVQRGDKILIENLNETWRPGDFVQIEGHNGIGKTSLLRILAGLALPKDGRVLWNGENIHQVRENYFANLLYVGHQSGVKPELTPWENLKFYQKITASQQGDEILWDVLEKVGLFGREDLPASQLSAGQQKRIALARLWLSKAPIWILDEPFNAIDKQGVQNLTTLFEQHCVQGGVVILTSHQRIPSDKLRILALEKYKYQEENL